MTQQSLFEKNISVRWSDLDPNFHLRHSVYYDFGAQQRIEILHAMGITPTFMHEQHFGPVLFREECIFRREIRFGDDVILTTKIASMKPDASRWSIQHEFLSPENKLLATLTIDGAWIDTHSRKLAASIPPLVVQVFETFPKTASFKQT